MPGLHRISLYELVSRFARKPLVHERQEHALGMRQAAERLQISLHGFGVDQKLVDDAREPVEREIEGHGRVRADHAPDGRMREVALMPSATFSIAGNA